MAHVEGEIMTDRPVEVVFDSVANESNEPLYNTEMLSATQTTDRPAGLGTRFWMGYRQEKRIWPESKRYLEG